MTSRRPVSSRGPLHTLTALGGLAHHGFELEAGVGLVFQPWLGLPGAAALWGSVFPAWLVASRHPGRGWDAPLAFAAGMSVGAVALHYAMWPWARRVGLPWLTEAEGLRPERLPAYNAILWAWGAAAVGALATETPRGLLPVALAGCATALTLRGSARAHFAWVREESRIRPAWWNRAFRETSGTTP